MKLVVAAAALAALSTPSLAHTWPKSHHKHHAGHPTKGAEPQAHDWSAPDAEARRRQNDCSNDDCRGINSSNGIGGSGGF
jgi:hypothetical protein